MLDSKRRELLKLFGATGLATMGGLSHVSTAFAKANAHIIVVGGGFGGATCASYIRQFDATIKVTLVEQNSKLLTCPFSNTVISGINKPGFISHSYAALNEQRGITLVHDKVVSIDPHKKRISLKSGKTLTADQLVISPGIDFKWQAIEGYDAAVSEKIPHAWQAGKQTYTLREQLVAMKDGGTVIISPPQRPFRAPPAPYERASLIAYYLKKNKPKSKVLILDANDDFAKQELFMQAWEKHYGGMIEWVKGSAGGQINFIDPTSLNVRSTSGQTYKGDVINLIPPQQAGRIALNHDMAEKNGWCNINQRTFESSKFKDIYILGDACNAGDMPKTGHAANSQAKVCAAAIVSNIHGITMPEPLFSSSIYSLVTPKYGISRAAVYRVKQGQIKLVSGGDSPLHAKKKFRLKEARYSYGWYKSLIMDTFGT